MAEFDEAISKGAEDAKRLADELERAEKAAESLTTGLSGGVGGGVKTEPNRSSPPNYQGMGGAGGVGGTGTNPYAAMGSDAAHQYTGMIMPDRPMVRGEKTQKIFGDIFANITGGLAAAAMALPEPNEALYTALMGERLRFYGARGVGGRKVEGLYGGQGAFKLQEQFSQMGTPTSALDAVYAANSAAGVGLLPGLRNFSRGLGDFGGVLGGAALASNLTPGLGLVGGIQAMGAMNQARRVNLLRMIGVNVRNIGGTEMKDLPEIIEQLFNILRHANGGVIPTAEDIAISAQSGNALDSILNQFFDDPNLRQVIISGLMQMSNTKGMSLRKGGRPRQLQKTGGSISAVRSIAQTDTTEMRMIQAFTSRTLAGTQIANKALRGFYDSLISLANGKGDVGGAIGSNVSNIAALMSLLETIGGARNGAGQLFITSMLSGVLGKVAGLFGAGAFLGDTAFSALQGGENASFFDQFLGLANKDTGEVNSLNWNDTWIRNSGKFNYLDNKGPNPLSSFSTTPMAAPSATSRTMAGNIVINAYANSSTDPVVMGAALAKEISNQATMSGAMF